MFSQSKEYSLEELLEHPVLAVEMASRGIDRRSLDLMLEMVGGQHGWAKPPRDEPAAAAVPLGFVGN